MYFCVAVFKDDFSKIAKLQLSCIVVYTKSALSTF